ncbi:hypothetical protein KP509_1Z204200 [Ceratopteris richardii]|nr:hypothetical protein KP509_1Z204200 [Ceratopteris richardii]
MRKQQKLHRTSRWNMEFLSSKGEMPEELKELLNQECQEEMCEQQKLNHKARQDMEWFFSKYMHEEKKLNHKDIVKRCQEEMHEQQKQNRKARQDMALLFLKDMHEEKKLNHNIREDKNHKICEDMELTSKEVRGDAMKCVPMRFSSIWDATTLEDMERSLTDSVYEPYSNRVKQSQTMPKSESCSYVKHKSHQKNEDSTAFDDVSKSIDAPPALGEAAHGVLSSDGRVAQQKYMVCIPHLHPKRFTGLIRALMATFRDIVGFYKKAEHGSVWLNVYVEFKTEEAMKNALAVGKVQLGDKICHIIKGDYSIFTSVVRITRLSTDISKRELKAICESYGKVDAIKKHATGAIDVFYDLEERGNMENILKRLNEFRFNGSTWMAAAAPALHPSTPKEMLKSPEGRAWHGDHSLMILFKMETGLDAVSVMFEDLKELLMGDHPST